MAGTKAVHPCDVRKPLAPWKKDHLYIDDRGEILCGACMGVESTYTPWAWSDLGPMAPDRTVTVPAVKVEVAPGRWVEHERTAYRCEHDFPAVREKAH